MHFIFQAGKEPFDTWTKEDFITSDGGYKMGRKLISNDDIDSVLDLLSRAKTLGVLKEMLHDCIVGTNFL